jgi:hypothetical protein
MEKGEEKKRTTTTEKYLKKGNYAIAKLFSYFVIKRHIISII